MAENDKPSEPAAPTPPADGAPPVPPKRSPGHRGADVKDTVAEMAAKARNHFGLGLDVWQVALPGVDKSSARS